MRKEKIKQDFSCEKKESEILEKVTVKEKSICLHLGNMHNLTENYKCEYFC